MRSTAVTTLCVAVLSLTLLGCSSEADDPRLAAPSESPTRVERTPSEPTPSATTGATAPLGVAYLEGTSPQVLQLPGGTAWELPQSYRGGRVIGDVFYGIYYDVEADRDYLQGVNRDGTIDSYGEIRGPIATNPAETTLAWLDGKSRLQTRWADDGVDMGVLSKGATLRRVTGGPNCYEDQDGCVVFHDERGAAHTADSHGIDDLLFPEALSVDDATEEGAVAVRTSVTDSGSCSAVLDLKKRVQRRTVAETCDYSFGRFSPDGSHLSAYDDYLDGIGAAYVAVLDSITLEETARFEPDDGFVAEAVWEDDEHLIINNYDNASRSWSVERLTLDGTTTRVLGPVRGKDIAPAFTLLGDN